MKMRNDSLGAAAAALVIMVVFGAGAYLMPSIMLALGDISPVIAGIVAILFVVAFFAVFFIRARWGRDDR